MHLRIKILIAALTALFGTLTFVSSAFADLNYTFNSASSIATTASGYTPSGVLNLTLGFAPTAGTNLTVVSNTGTTFISGTFTNVAQGGTVGMTYNGVTYYWVANYYGGNGRSLVLQWPHIAYDAWGNNNESQVGVPSTGSGDYRTSPIAISTAGTPLAGKTIVSFATGGMHNLVLTSDGQMYTWGGAPGLSTATSVPVAVATTGTPDGGQDRGRNHLRLLQ